MKKINSKPVFSVIHFCENRYWIMSRGRAYILNENNDIEFLTHHIQNIHMVFWNDNQEQFIYSNTSGKCIFTKAYQQEEILKIFIKPFSDFPLVSFNNNYIYIDKSGTLKLLNNDSKKSTKLSFDYVVHHIVKYKDKFILYIEKNDFEYYLELCSFDGVKMICEKEMFLPGDWLKQMQLFGDNLLAYMNNIEMDERMEPTIGYVDIKNWECHRFFVCKDVCDSPDVFSPYRFSISPGGRFIAMINSEYVQIYDVNEKKIVYNESVVYGSNVCWKDDSELFIGTWNGLYVHRL